MSLFRVLNPIRLCGAGTAAMFALLPQVLCSSCFTADPGTPTLVLMRHVGK